MKNLQVLFGKFLLVLLCFTCIGLVGCADTENPEPTPEPKTDYEFVFEGSDDFESGGITRHLDISVYGNKDDEKSVLLKVKQLPQIEYYGTWVLVPNKGYKIYFEDSRSTYVYCRYDTEKKQFGFNYRCSFGNAGTKTVAFSYEDKSFEYDGIGLGLHPPVIGSLTCNEDGTFVVGSRTGTWEYLPDTNQYYFHFGKDTGYMEAFKLDEWHEENNDRGKDGIFEWQVYDYTATGFSSKLWISGKTGLPCNREYTIDEDGVIHTTTPEGHEVYYTIDAENDNAPYIMEHVYANFNAETGKYEMVYITGSYGYRMTYATFEPEE
ncbi:MAG TPA: hypothetical protein DDY77_02245 [Clostridiales bacterium]|nr:hypothetical protein [Clostridiales bacterium]